MRIHEPIPAMDAHPSGNVPARELGAWLAEVLDAVIVVGSDGRVVYLNRAAEHLLDMSPESAQGQPIERVLSLQDGATKQPLDARDIPAHPARFTGAFQLLNLRSGVSLPVHVSSAKVRGKVDSHVDTIISLRDASDLQRSIDRLVDEAMHDEHTRLLRRAALVRRLSRLLRESGVREGHAFMYMDLDKFKAVNDSAGHAAGDLAIRQIAARFREVVRSGDSLARLGGDEFGLLLERCPAERARERAIQLNQAMAEYVLRWDGKSHQLGIRIGIALFKGRTPILRTILAAADTACYQAKRAGGEGGFGRSTLLEGRPLSVSNIVETSNT